MNFEKYYTKRAKPLQASGIREMFKLMADPAVISLAGGSPDPELFPTEELSEIAAVGFKGINRLVAVLCGKGEIKGRVPVICAHIHENTVLCYGNKAVVNLTSVGSAA